MQIAAAVIRLQTLTQLPPQIAVLTDAPVCLTDGVCSAHALATR